MKSHECFNLVLKEYQHEFSAKDLAEVSGVPESTVSNFKRGKINPKLETFDKLRDGLHKLSPAAYARFHCLMASSELDLVQLAANSPLEIQRKILVAIANNEVFTKSA